MATKIIMRDTGTVLDTKPEMGIEMKKTSPIFSEVGSSTIADALPATVLNKRILSFPGRPDIFYRTKKLFPVIFETDSLQQAGELHVVGSQQDEISFNIGTDESVMYSMIKERKISDLEKMPIYRPDRPSLYDSVAAVVDYLHTSRNDLDAPLAVFPVVLGDEEVNGTRRLTIANKYAPHNAGAILLLEWNSRTITENINGTDISVDVPDGYGVAPFPRIWKVLEIIFDNFGFTIEENVFKEHFQLKLLTSLHNCVDAICLGEINYKNIVPETSISDFLDALYNKFGALFFVDSTKKTVKIKLLHDILNSTSFADIGMWKDNELSWSEIAPKQVKLKLKTGLEGAKPPMESYSDFVKSRNLIIDSVGDYEGLLDNTFVFSLNLPYNTIRSLGTGSYYSHTSLPGPGKLYKNELLGSDFFEWDQKTEGIEYETLESKDESVPIKYISQQGYFPYYIVGKSHKLTNLVNVSNPEKEKENNSNLAFIFFFIVFHRGSDPTHIASPFPTDVVGNPLTDDSFQKYLISLTARSLYENFWKEYDSVIRHANQEYKANFNLSKTSCLKFDMSGKVMVDNQPYLPKELNFSFGDGNNIPEITMRSLHLLRPYNLELDRYVPEIQPQKYFWGFYNGYQDELNHMISIKDSYLDYFRDKHSNPLDPMPYEDRVDVVSYSTIDNPTISDVSFVLPPNSEDYQNKTHINEKLYRATIRYDYYKKYQRPLAQWGRLEILNVEFKYKCYSHPELIQ